MPTVIAFDYDHSVTVTEELDLVVDTLRAAASGEPPLAKLTRSKGEIPIFINANLVRAVWFWEPKSRAR